MREGSSSRRRPRPGAPAMLRSWPTLSHRVLADCMPIFRLYEEVRRSPRTGNAKPFFILEALDWVNVVPLTADGQVVLVRQFRHGTREVTLEIPGGMVPQGMSPEEAARRELREETGYEAEQLVPIGVMTPNPAILTNRCYTFLALNAHQAGDQEQEPFEDIHVELAPLKTVPQLIASGRITHALVIAAFHFYELWRTGHGPERSEHTS